MIFAGIFFVFHTFCSILAIILIGYNILITPCVYPLQSLPQHRLAQVTYQMILYDPVYDVFVAFVCICIIEHKLNGLRSDWTMR